MKKNIILIGMMGCGKTTIAKLMAKSLNWTFIDADSEMSRNHNKTIQEVFHEIGEARFRQSERDFYSDLLSKSTSQSIISTGGGAILQAGDLLKELGFCIWLKADIETLANRLTLDTASETQRPLLQSSNQKSQGNKASTISQKLSSLLEERTPIYQKLADLLIEVDQAQPEVIATRILNQLPTEFSNHII